MRAVTSEELNNLISASAAEGNDYRVRVDEEEILEGQGKEDGGLMRVIIDEKERQITGVKL